MPTATRSLLAFSLLLVLAWLLPVSPAEAGVRICKAKYTNTADRQRLRAAMQRVLPSDVPAAGIPDICRNPGSASGWLSTAPRLASDGVVEWWTVSCDRHTGDWACDAPEHNQLIWVYAEVGGVLRRLEVSFDDATGLDRARAVAVRSMRFIQDPASLPTVECGLMSRPLDRSAWDKARSEYVLSPTDTAAEVAVTTDKEGSHFMRDGWAGGLGLRFTDGSDLASSERRPCYEEWIVVG